MGESLDQRIAREEPELSWNDVVAADDDPVAGRLVQPDQGMVDFDATAEEVGDVVPDTVGLSAEEQAVRIETDPDGPEAREQEGPGEDDVRRKVARQASCVATSWRMALSSIPSLAA
jgi:hypothetical protein